MPDDPTGQAPTDPAPPTDPPADPPTDPVDPPADPPPADPADDPAAAALKKANAEAAKYRRELREREAELKKFQDAQLSDQEKLAKRAAESEARVTELEAKARAALLRAEITSAAAKAGVTDVTDATLLLPTVGQVEWDDETGEPTNIAALVEKLVEAKPYLVAQQDDPAPPRRQGTAPAAARRGGGRFSAQQVAALTPEQWRTLSPDDHAAAMAALGQ